MTSIVTLEDLAALMAEHGLSQERLARFLGVGRSTVQRAFATKTVGPTLALAVINKRKEFTPMKRTTCITPSMLLAAGYKTYTDATKRENADYKLSYQKRVEDDNGTLYFINIDHGHLVMKGVDFEYTTPYVQFTRGGTTFNVEMLHHTETVEQVEAFFRDLWTTMGCDRYE